MHDTFGFHTLSRRLCCIGLATLAAAMVAGCGDAPATDEKGYRIDLAYTPTDIHPRDVVRFVFTVKRDGEAVSGLSPKARFEQVAGGTASAPIALAAGAAAGTYEGKRDFPADGTYSVLFSFEEGGKTVEQSFSLSAITH